MIQKKNGFTLVELLAVIVVLAIIITIGITSVTAIMKRMKKNVSNEMRNNLKEAGITYVLDQNFHLEKCSSDFSKQMMQNNISNLNSNISCVKSLDVATLKAENFFEDNKGYCKSTEKVIVYRYTDDVGNSEYRAYVDSRACTSIK